jgi:hypothetical protein
LVHFLRFGLYSTALCDDLLDAVNAVFLDKKIKLIRVNPCKGSVAYLELLHQGIVDLAVHRCENTLLRDGSIQNLLDGNTAWDANYFLLITIHHYAFEWKCSPSLAMAEYPAGLPYSQRVESLVCLVPSFSSTSNLCCSLRSVSITLSEHTTCKSCGNCTQDMSWHPNCIGIADGPLTSRDRVHPRRIASSSREWRKGYQVGFLSG